MKSVIKHVVAASVMMALAVPAFAANVKIENGKTVVFDYTLKIDGKVVESSEGKKPVQYVQGSKSVIKGLQNALLGLQAGDKRSITLKPEEAYGVVNPQAIKEIDKSKFDKDATFKKGMVVQLESASKKVAAGIVAEIKDKSIVVNFNHPLAGKTLTFDVAIKDVK